MTDINKYEIKGRAGMDAETRFTATGKQLTRFSVATSESHNGNEYTTWHIVKAWEKVAQQCDQIQKGDVVHVIGKFRTESWERDGVKKYASYCLASKVEVEGKEKPAEPQPQQNNSDDDSFPF